MDKIAQQEASMKLYIQLRLKKTSAYYDRGAVAGKKTRKKVVLARGAKYES